MPHPTYSFLWIYYVLVSTILIFSFPTCRNCKLLLSLTRWGPEVQGGQNEGRHGRWQVPQEEVGQGQGVGLWIGWRLASCCETWKKIFQYQDLGVSKNRGKPPKSSILIGFSIINHPFWGIPIFGNIHIRISCLISSEWQLFLHISSNTSKVPVDNHCSIWLTSLSI